MLRRLLLGTALGTLLVVFAANCDDGEGGSEPGVTLAINPTGIPADGESMAEVTVTVTNYSGTVVLTTNRGTFPDSNSSTLGIDVSGSVKTLIKSCREGFVEDCVGTASIRATADTALGFASIRYLSTGAGGGGGSGPSCLYESSCDNGGDEDLDGYVDCEDDDCCGDPACELAAGGAGGSSANDCASYETACTDLEDNDGDGGIDCEDSNCCADPACAEGTGGAGGGGGSGGGGGGGPGPGSCNSLEPGTVYMYGVLNPTQAWPAFSAVSAPLAPCTAFPNRVITDLTVRPDGALLYLVPGYRESPSFESTMRIYSEKEIQYMAAGNWLYPQFREIDHPTILAPGCTPGEPTRAFLGQGNEVIYQCNQEIEYWRESPSGQLDTLGKELVAVGDGALLTRDPAGTQHYLMTGDWFNGSASETLVTFPAGVAANSEILAVRPFGPGGFRIVLAPLDEAGTAQRITVVGATARLDGDYSALPATHGRYHDAPADGFGQGGYDHVPNAVLDGDGNLWELVRTRDIGGGQTGPMAVARRQLGGGATELRWEDTDYTDTDHPPEMHLPDRLNAVGLFTGVDAGSGGGEGGAGGGGP